MLKSLAYSTGESTGEPHKFPATHTHSFLKYPTQPNLQAYLHFSQYHKIYKPEELLSMYFAASII